MDPIKWVAKAVGKDPTRAALLVTWRQDKIRWATNGQRLHLAPDPDQPPGVTCEPVDTDKVYGVSPPPYQQVIPDDSDHNYLIGSASMKILRKALHEADKIGPPRTRREVRLELRPDSLAVIAMGVEQWAPEPTMGDGFYATHQDEYGIVAVVAATPWRSLGVKKPIKIAANIAYLMEACEGSTGVWIQISGDTDPIKITHDDGRIAVVMPMRM